MAIFLRNGKKAEYNESQDILLKHIYSSVAGRALLKVMTLPVISKIGGAYLSTPLSKIHIQPFIKSNHIDMSDYEPKEYESYNDFFTRNVKMSKRPFSKEDTILCSPCDAKVSYHPIDDDTVITVKNTHYTLDDLLLSPYLSQAYRGGSCLIFRLTVDDYHHYHYIDEGYQDDERRINGIFHTVNPIANDYYPIYKRNTRQYTILHTDHFDDVVMMEVGALMVGKIVNLPKKHFHRGEEKGYFEFGGSTVILLFKKDTIAVDEDIVEHSKNHDEVRIKLGEHIGKRVRS